jgi:hypothetical protein
MIATLILRSALSNPKRLTSTIPISYDLPGHAK